MDAATPAGGQPAFSLPTHACILIVCPVRLLSDGLVDSLEAEAGLRVVARAEARAVALASGSASLAGLVRILEGLLPADGDDAAAHAVARPPPSSGQPRRPLTRRERQILEQIRAGHSNKEIARSLGIEPATVKCHVHNLLAKLKVRRRGQAALCIHEHERSVQI